MVNIGEQLSAARQLAGLTASDAAARLRIRTMFVQALEREEWETIGEFVYVRGFLKNYARLLGLDPTPLLQQLSDEYEPEPAQPRPIQETFGGNGYLSGRQDVESRPGRWFPWILGTLTTIAAALVIMVGISLFSLLSSPSGSGSQTSVQSTAAALPQPPAAANTLETSSDVQNQVGGVNLRLQLTQRSWLSITVDGKRVVYETLPAGTVREFHGAREITLRAGNAGGVVANIDGKNLGRLGQAGQVEDRVFAVKTSPDQLKGWHE